MSEATATVGSSISPNKGGGIKPLNPSAIAFEARTPPPQALQGGGGFTAYPPPPPQQQQWSVEEQSQQQFGPAGQQGSAAEREFIVTRSMLPHVQRPVLAAVLTSLLDDFPHLAPLIRYRCEKVAASLGSQQQNTGVYGSPQAQGAPWQSPGGDMGGGLPAGATPPSQRKVTRSGGGLRHRDEEQELCAVHGNMRPLKHLMFRPQTGMYECIHGYHCLESREPSLTPSNSVTPKKDMQQLGGPMLPHRTTSPPPPLATSEASAQESIDVAKLQNLLSHVRKLDEAS